MKKTFPYLFTLAAISCLAVSCEDKMKNEADYYSDKMKELEEQRMMNAHYGDPEHIGKVRGVDGNWYDVNDNQAYVSDTASSFRNNGDLYDDSEEGKKKAVYRRHDDGM